MTCRCHSCRNYQSVTEPAAPKPRRMKGNADYHWIPEQDVQIHREPHQENPWCATFRCQPLDPKPQWNTLPDAKIPEPQRPEPGEGWRLLADWEEVRAGDEYYSEARLAWNSSVMVGGRPFRGFLYRRRVEQAAQDCPHKQYDALSAIVAERERQDEKWGEQNHSWQHWLVILMEEVGEASEAALKGQADEFRMEMVQVAAVALNAIECFDRNRLALKEGKA